MHARRLASFGMINTRDGGALKCAVVTPFFMLG